MEEERAIWDRAGREEGGGSGIGEEEGLLRRGSMVSERRGDAKKGRRQEEWALDGTGLVARVENLQVVSSCWREAETAEDGWRD